MEQGDLNLPPLVQGSFVKRDNRFRATVTVAGRQAWAHVPNSGRLGELLTPGRPVWLAPAGDPERKTAYDLKLVEFAGVLVSVDARLPNPLLAEALAGERLQAFDYPEIRREVALGASRLDFRLSGPDGACWVETKSVTLVTDGLAQFPDAPTERGRKHLSELMKARASGDRAAVVFVVQRADAVKFTPYSQADPLFAAALQDAAAAGVEIYAFTCRVSLESIFLAAEIPVTLL
ncbi:MAG: DNA/RNA nuclease SfsA [Chloroflexota bacterium]|nr:MAG: DNA/RNA nuclease SfsA [Chloroflexota bacterium]